ncbi:hypothetical protein B0A48_07066 [Cryoendolithus antarcticus]|uniref:DUF1749-domain-containing protein n=1 Tax=Cryoendolithus antarcticus TaxID=1507870 RepID=A0A1V8T7R1_9PEZI|nr:hypothetical protein B0A48_07066 [Cryoendolithus antarcticus]
MDSHTSPPPSSHPGTLHFIPPNLSAFEPSKPLARSLNINTLLWIGGLFDTYLSVSYPLRLAHALGPTWSLMTASLSSAGHSWGTSSIARDAEEIGKIVAMIKHMQPGGKVVIMGHSTGCQDCMEYVVGKGKENRPPVEGVILQAPVSDREAIEADVPAAMINEANQLALKMCREGHDKDVMPNRLTKVIFDRVAITARRWVDIASPAPTHDGADDYFSSDLSDERLAASFGKFLASTALLILEGGSDESVPESIDKHALVSRWTAATLIGGGVTDNANGGVVEGASHNLNGSPEAVVQDLIRRVVGFVGRLDGGELVHAAGGARI